MMKLGGPEVSCTKISVSSFITSHVPAVEQLAVEVFVGDSRRPVTFYTQHGFDVAEDRGTFVVLTWDGHAISLDRRPNLPNAPVPRRRRYAWWPTARRTGRRAETLGADLLPVAGSLRSSAVSRPSRRVPRSLSLSCP